MMVKNTTLIKSHFNQAQHGLSLRTDSRCNIWTSEEVQIVNHNCVYIILFYPCYMFRLFWEAIIGQFKKYTMKDNLNAILYYDTPSNSWDINFTGTVVV
jgi:hypothetical protein